MRFKLAMACAVAFLCFVPSAFSTATRMVIALPPEGYPPYIIIDEFAVHGLLIEPLLLAAKNADIEYRFVFLPEKRSLKALNEGKIDARMESVKWVENPEQYLWTRAITELEDVIVYNSQYNFIFNKIDDLNNTEIVTHLGYSYPKIDALFAAKKAWRSDRYNEKEMLSALLRVSPDITRLAVMNKHVARWIIHNDRKFAGQFTITDTPLDSAPLQFQIRKTALNAQRLAYINRELAKLEQQGVTALIEARILEGKNNKREIN